MFETKTILSESNFMIEMFVRFLGGDRKAHQAMWVHRCADCTPLEHCRERSPHCCAVQRRRH